MALIYKFPIQTELVQTGQVYEYTIGVTDSQSYLNSLYPSLEEMGEPRALFIPKFKLSKVHPKKGLKMGKIIFIHSALDDETLMHESLHAAFHLFRVAKDRFYIDGELDDEEFLAEIQEAVFKAIKNGIHSCRHNAPDKL